MYPEVVVTPALHRPGPHFSLAKFGLRLLIPLALAVGLGLFVGTWWREGAGSITGRTVALALVTTSAFSLGECWPSRLPGWLARWALQIVVVAAVVPLTTWLIWTLSTASGAPAFWHD